MTPLQRRNPPEDRLLHAMLLASLTVPALLVLAVLVYALVDLFS